MNENMSFFSMCEMCGDLFSKLREPHSEDD